MISENSKVKVDLAKIDREGNYILIKGSIDTVEIAVLKMYVPNGIASKFLKEKLAEFEEEIDSNIILVRNSNLPI